jgi:methionyl-tRNA formyltransferase
MRAVFFGTPEIAVPALRALAETAELVGVVCQPDRPSGRGLELRAPPVKLAARELGIEAYQPLKIRSGELGAWLRERAPDVAVVLAYGRILPKPVLDAPRRGCINLHASLLPRWRGAAPIQWAIAHGDTETGISLMQMDEGMDTGPVYALRKLPIGDQETAGELAVRIAELAAVVVREDLPRAVAGELVPAAQDERLATLAPMIGPDQARIDWSRSASEIANLVRGMSPRPGAHSRVRGKLLRVLGALPAAETGLGPPGTVAVLDRRRLLVAAGRGSVEILRAQLEGKKALEARDLINGRALAHGDLLAS